MITATCASRMHAAVCKTKGDGNNIIFLSPMHISQRAIIGYDVLDMDPQLVGLNGMQLVLARSRLVGEHKFRKGQYILECMKKVPEYVCILAAHQFG